MHQVVELAVRFAKTRRDRPQRIQVQRDVVQSNTGQWEQGEALVVGSLQSQEHLAAEEKHRGKVGLDAAKVDALVCNVLGETCLGDICGERRRVVALDLTEKGIALPAPVEV